MVQLGRGFAAWAVSAVAMNGTAIVDYWIWDWTWGRIQELAPLVNLGPLFDYILLAAMAPLVLGFVLFLVLLPVIIASSARDGVYLMLGGGLDGCLMKYAMSRTGKSG